MDLDAGILKLTPYEVDRQPQEVPGVEDGVITITGRLLENELQCGICLGLLRNTRTTKECLHRFCDECISQALRTGNKSCPSCRCKLVSMRSLRPDPLFDDIIKTIFPQREEMEEHQAALLTKLSSKTPRRRGNGEGKRIGQSTAVEEPIAGTSGTSLSAAEERRLAEEPTSSADLMGFELTPYMEKMKGPRNGDLVGKWKQRLIRVKPNAKIGLVCRFVLTRLLVEREKVSTVDVAALDVSKVQIYLRQKHGLFRLLEHDQTLTEVHDLYWNIKRPMKLCFAFTGNIKLK